MATRKSKKSKARYSKKRLTLRNTFWPAVEESALWDRNKRDGFTTIPRTISLVAKILDDLSAGGPLGRVYMDLWCQMTDESVIEVDNEAERAFTCGYTGQRAVYTWRDRIKELERLGFIKTAEAARGPHAYVLMLNPHKIIAADYKSLGVSQQNQVTFLEVLTRIGANDFDEE